MELMGIIITAVIQILRNQIRQFGVIQLIQAQDGNIVILNLLIAYGIRLMYLKKLTKNVITRLFIV